MLKKYALSHNQSPRLISSPIVIRNSSPFSTQKTNNIDPQTSLHSMGGLPIRATPKHMSETFRREALLTPRDASIDQIKSKLKEYLRKTQENSLLNYQNESLPDFTRKSVHQNFRMTLFRNNLKKRINLKILQTAPFGQRYESSPQFSVSEALINRRAKKQMDQSDKMFYPKRQYYIHHRKKKERVPIPRIIPPKTVYPLTNRQSSFRQRERGGLGVQPWRRWGRDSEEGDLAAPEDI